MSTARRAHDLASGPHFYGWTDVDLWKVGAPLCSRGPEPSPASRDPVSPGVVVLDTSELGRIDPTVDPTGVGMTVVIGTVSNLRDGSMWTDGCGIGLYLEGWDGTCYRGIWDKWSIVVDGTGVFRACPRAER